MWKFKTTVFTIVTIASIAILVPLPTLWFLEHQVKYSLYLFEVAFIVLLSVVYSKRLTRTHLKFKFSSEILTYLFDYLFVALSLILFLLNLYEVRTIARAVLATIVPSFLPGYALLRVMKFHCLHSHLETFTLSFAISLPLTCIISSFLVPISQRALLASIIYILLSFLPIFKNKIEKKSELANEAFPKAPHVCELSEVLFLGLITVFFIVIVRELYPQMAWACRVDIAHHYSKALLFSRSPYSFSSQYPFFIVFEATIIELSNSSMIIVKTAVAYMSIMVIFSFYMMANLYLKKIDSRLPITATIAWFLFSGFGWLYFLEMKLTQNNLSQMTLLNWAYDKSYADIGYGIGTNLWLWFLPMTVSFTIFFTLIYLLKRTDISKRSFVPIFSLLIMALFFIHIPELVMFVVLLVVLSFFTPKINLRQRDALFSTLIGLASVTMLSIWYSRIGIPVGVPYYLTSAMFIVTLFVYILMSRRWEGFHSDKGWKIIIAAVAVLLILFFGGLFAWFSSAVSFSLWCVIEMQLIPWLLYPVRLGIVGALSLIGVTIVAKKYRCFPIVLFVCLLFSALFVGRIVSIINFHYATGYWEWRFLFFIFAAASMLAPIAILKGGKIFPKKRVRAYVIRKYRRNPRPRSRRINHETLQTPKSVRAYRSARAKDKGFLLSTLLLGIIIFSGFSSTFLTLELQVNSLLDPMQSTETDALSFLSSLLKGDIAPSLLNIPESSSISNLVPVSYAYSDILPMIWTSNYPEIPLNILYNKKFSNTYVYLSEGDLNTLNYRYANGCVAQHLLQGIPEVFNNSEVQIYKLRDGVPPLSNGETVLVVPFNDNSDNSYLFAYDILSLGGYNYTVMFDSDHNILQNRTIVIPFDKSTYIVNGILQDFEVYDGKRFVIFNTNGYGPLSRLFFEIETEATLKASSISGAGDEINLPVGVDIPLTSTKEDVQVLGWYVGDKTKTVLSAKINTDEKEIIYINVYPLVKAMLSNQKTYRNLYPVLGKLLDVIGIDLPKYDVNVISWIMNDSVPVFLFKEAQLNGTVIITSTSIFFPKELSLERVDLNTSKYQLSLFNVGSMSIENMNYAEVFSDAITTREGRGFYASLIVNNPKMMIKGDNILVSINLMNGTKMSLDGGISLQLSIEGQTPVYVREPHISINGGAFFKEAYTLHTYLAELRTLGQDLHFQGIVEFKLPLSDEYSFALKFTWSGSHEREPPILQWNEWKSFTESSPWLIILSIFIVAFFLTKRYLGIKRKRIQKTH